ncbi:hypothetical protein [Sphingomonas sp. ACRSK]|uniref:hypothetical protein n=1 Tax=Sphingomonas sp. ACRSK TaxID=2918213 RepID=UPI001EF68010|nr:hypothetical protein [Sphingomonas sp. ACRSK]MCG7347837.1 hypothetical protein [Sphingomonas sp. ACRSK]
MRFPTLIVPALALALTACGGNSEPQPNAADNGATAEATQQLDAKVAALSEGQRNGVFIRAIRDAGLPCQGVTASERSGDAQATWTATCTDGSKHIIAFTPDGMAKVTSMTRK